MLKALAFSITLFNCPRFTFYFISRNDQNVLTFAKLLISIPVSLFLDMPTALRKFFHQTQFFLSSHFSTYKIYLHIFSYKASFLSTQSMRCNTHSKLVLIPQLCLHHPLEFWSARQFLSYLNFKISISICSFQPVNVLKTLLPK